MSVVDLMDGTRAGCDGEQWVRRIEWLRRAVDDVHTRPESVADMEELIEELEEVLQDRADYDGFDLEEPVFDEDDRAILWDQAERTYGIKID